MSANWERTASEAAEVLNQTRSHLDDGTPFDWDRGYLKGVAAALAWALNQYLSDPLENYE